MSADHGNSTGPPKRVNGWTIPPSNLGNFSTAYLERAVVAMTGLGANVPADAVYLSCGTVAGQPLRGAERYLVHFAARELPPVRAFWSITVYGEDGFFVPNDIDRYAIHSWDNTMHNGARMRRSPSWQGCTGPTRLSPMGHGRCQPCSDTEADYMPVPM